VPTRRRRRWKFSGLAIIANREHVDGIREGQPVIQLGFQIEGWLWPSGLIAQVKLGDNRAYEPIVRHFQDMAVAYGYATLGDWQLAEDAAQEAFIAAYCELPALRDPQAFPGGFRRIVIKQIDRIRRRRPRYRVLDGLSKVAANQHNPSEVAEQQELHDSIVNAIRSLPTRHSAAWPQPKERGVSGLVGCELSKSHTSDGEQKRRAEVYRQSRRPDFGSSVGL
jgi:DNA-directed RNA polymerase specialized sigma24 family protein